MQRVKVLPVVVALFLSFSAAVMLGESRAAYVVHGNYKSRIYHNSGCRYFNCKACTVVFRSAEEARSAGYRPCKVCGG